MAACARRDDAPLPQASAWPEADTLFRSDPRWMGADGAYSVPLGGDRTLWLFGDTFVARDAAHPSASAAFVRNSVAIQTGLDPSRAFIQFYWGSGDDGVPKSFLPEDGAVWFWPGHGVRVGDTLLSFWGRVGTPADDPSGFAGAGPTRALVIDNPDDEPTHWNIRDAKMPADARGIDLGGAVFPLGDWLYAYGSRGQFHALYVARFRLDDARIGDLSSPEWFGDAGWSSTAEPTALLELGAPEYSVHFDGKLGRYVMAITQGYGATTLAIRVADAPEGPWSDARSFFRPPESFDDDAFVYAGKAHPELLGADLVMTYVPSSFADRPDASDSLYHPHFVRMRWP